jgi:hypothetical protein
MRKAYKYRIYPTKEQEEKIQFTLERCRLLYNRLLDERRFAYETDKTTLNYYDQANTLNERKKYIPALKQVHSQVLQDVVKRLDKAFQAFFRRMKAGETPGYPILVSSILPSRLMGSFTNIRSSCVNLNGHCTENNDQYHARRRGLFVVAKPSENWRDCMSISRINAGTTRTKCLENWSMATDSLLLKI